MLPWAFGWPYARNHFFALLFSTPEEKLALYGVNLP